MLLACRMAMFKPPFENSRSFRGIENFALMRKTYVKDKSSLYRPQCGNHKHNLPASHTHTHTKYSQVRSGWHQFPGLNIENNARMRLGSYICIFSCVAERRLVSVASRASCKCGPTKIGASQRKRLQH